MKRIRRLMSILGATTILLSGCSEPDEETIDGQFIITDYVTGQPIVNAEVYRVRCTGDDANTCEKVGESFYSDAEGLAIISSVKENDDFEINAEGYHSYWNLGKYHTGYQYNQNEPLRRQYQMLPEATLNLTILGNPLAEEIRDYAVFGCYFKEETFHSEIGSYIPSPIVTESICYGKTDGFGMAYMGNWQGMFSDCPGCYFGSEYPRFYNPGRNRRFKVWAPGDTYLVLRVWLVTGPDYYRDTQDISKTVFIPRNKETRVVIDLNQF